MTLADHRAIGRITALGILAGFTILFLVGPFAAYCGWISGNNDALAAKAALLQRYRALASTDTNTPAVLQRYRALASTDTNTPAPAGPALLYPDIPESQASALLQETVKNTAAAAHVQVQGLQVLRSEAQSGATRIGIRIRASGDMASLRSLVYAIETARPVLYPDNLAIQSHATSPEAAPSALDFQLDISGFKTEPQS